MKALVFNSSPSMDKGNTALILNPFVEGLKEEGAETELLYLGRLRVNPCQGDFYCWFKKPGECVQEDDMQMILQKLRGSDIVVFATPLYVDGMAGRMKNLVDRLVAIMEPYIELVDGHCRHLRRKNYKPAKAVLVSSCAFWEIDNFDSLVGHFQAVCRNASWDYAGALLRPHSGAFGYMLKKGYPVQDVVEAAREAGKQLVGDGRMKDQTLAIVRRELVPLELYVEMFNQGIKKSVGESEETSLESQNK